jgi:hypothetical protein
MTRVEAIYLSKRFLRDQIFRKYPRIAQSIMEGSKLRYMQNIRKVLNDQRMGHLKDVNAQSRYKTFSIQDKFQNLDKPNSIPLSFAKKPVKNYRNRDLSTPMGSIISIPPMNHEPKATTLGTQESLTSSLTQSSAIGIIKESFSPKFNRTDLAFIIKQRLQHCDQEM